YRLIARRVLLPWMLQGERPSGEGLEIGGGSGAMSAQLLMAFPGVRMVVTDYDPDMTAAAQRTLAPFGERARAERADAADLPFADGRFSFVLSAAMLHHVVAWENALAEALRVLRPGAARRLRSAGCPAVPAAAFRRGPRHHDVAYRPAGSRIRAASRRGSPRPAERGRTGGEVRRRQGRLICGASSRRARPVMNAASVARGHEGESLTF